MRGLESRNLEPVRASDLKALLDRHGIRLKKSLGQHFLVDGNILRRIAETIWNQGRDHLVEVGAGVGTLTQLIAPRAARLWAVEVDGRLIPLLRERLAPWPQVEVIQADFLALELAELGRELLVVGNLPYRITSGVLLKLIRERQVVSGGVFLVQEEVAAKLVAPPGHAASRLGIHLRAYYEVEIVRRVPRTAFFPRPEVDSALIVLGKLPAPRISSPPDAFERTLALVFSGRRKTLRRALAARLPREEVDRLLGRLGLDPKARGEALPLEELDRLAAALAPLLKPGA